MNGLQINVENLNKTYRVPVRPEGLGASIKSLLKPVYRDVKAIRDVSFKIEAGEVVGLIGPNGAGKTTLLKILSGLLHPTSGEAQVAGFIPWQRRPDYLRTISMVMGNKNQMLWDIPAMDSFRVMSEIYSVPKETFRRNLDELAGLLDLQDLLIKPVRNLSLGERMKCELAASLLYHPRILFLDEPTLGLDVSTQLRLRRFLADYNRRYGTTVVLTSHYMADVTALCPRVILVNEGQVIHDGDLEGLARRLIPYKIVRVTFNEETSEPLAVINRFNGAVEVIENENNHLALRLPRQQAPAITARLLQDLPVADLSVEDPPIEAVIDLVFSGGRP